MKKIRSWDMLDNRSRSRDRGYNFENRIVKDIDKFKGWKALRLGGTQTKIPDIVAVSDNKTLLAIEAKSTTSTSVTVPEKQVKRCAQLCDILTAYDSRWVVLAFKFSVKKRIKLEFERRELKEYFVLMTPYQANLSGDFKMGYNEDRKYQQTVFKSLQEMMDFLEGKKLYVF